MAAAELRPPSPTDSRMTTTTFTTFVGKGSSPTTSINAKKSASVDSLSSEIEALSTTLADLGASLGVDLLGETGFPPPPPRTAPAAEVAPSVCTEGDQGDQEPPPPPPPLGLERWKKAAAAAIGQRRHSATVKRSIFNR